MVICDTPESIEAFRLLALRGALRLETLGMKNRGGSAFATVKAMLGVKSRDKRRFAR